MIFDIDFGGKQIDSSSDEFNDLTRNTITVYQATINAMENVHFLLVNCLK